MAQLAAALESRGQNSDSIRLYRRALELKPEDPRLLNSLASLIVENNGDINEARRLAERAVLKSPDEPKFMDTLGWTYYKENMTDRALQLFNRLVKQYPSDPTFRYHLGATLLQKGDPQAGREALQLALANKPSKENVEKVRQLLAGVH